MGSGHENKINFCLYRLTPKFRCQVSSSKLTSDLRLLTGRLCFLLSAFLLASTATVQAEDYLYETNNGTISITKYIGLGGEVTIPDEINGLPVTAIGDYAFYSCTSDLRDNLQRRHQH